MLLEEDKKSYEAIRKKMSTLKQFLFHALKKFATFNMKI